MFYKILNNEKLYFSELVLYEGPVTLQLLPPNSILHILDKYIIDIDFKYYEIIKVIYLDKEYDFKDFILKYPKILNKF